MRRHLPRGLSEFVMFGLQQGWAWLFGGLMPGALIAIAAVGSLMARMIRIFDMRFSPYPPDRRTVGMALAIYANFLTRTWLPDARHAATLWLFWRTRIWFRIGANRHGMPLPLAAILNGLFLWIAENVGTDTGTRVYRDALKPPKRSLSTTDTRLPGLKSAANSAR